MTWMYKEKEFTIRVKTVTSITGTGLKPDFYLMAPLLLANAPILWMSNWRSNCWMKVSYTRMTKIQFGYIMFMKV